MSVQKVFVTPGERGTVRCPQCGLSRTIKVTKFKNRRSPVKARCPCNRLFDVFFESRRAARQEAYLDGYYGKMPTYEIWGKMVVRNVSPIGIGFSTPIPHSLSVGDELRTTFPHPTASHVDVDRNGVVRVAEDNYVGLEFRNPARLDKAEGFQIRNYAIPHSRGPISPGPSRG